VQIMLLLLLLLVGPPAALRQAWAQQTILRLFYAYCNNSISWHSCFVRPHSSICSSIRSLLHQLQHTTATCSRPAAALLLRVFAAADGTRAGPQLRAAAVGAAAV
jgi:hypothetical protein